MNLAHLSIFRAVAEEGSVSRGADRLMVSQPAVSKQLAQFERSLGVRLLDRLPRGVRLTQAGELLLVYAQRIFSIEEQARVAIDELRGLKRGQLRIGASPTTGTYLLPDVLVSFRRAFPQIQTRLGISRSADVERQLLNGELDLGITETFSGEQQVQATVFRTDELVPIASRTHPLARKRRVPAAVFCRERFIVRDTGSETKSFVERALDAKGLTIKPAYSLGSTEAIKCAVAAGLGVAIVSRLAIGLEVQARRLAAVRVTGLTIRRPLYLLRVRGTQPSKATEAFIKLLRSE